MLSIKNPRKYLPYALFLCLSTAAVAQNSSLTLASGSALQGSSVQLNLVLAVAGGAPADLQWTLSYTPGSIASISIAAGPALTAAGKTVSCAAASGSVSCLATGMNAGLIGSGTVATATVVLGTAAGGSVVPISLAAVGASPAGNGTIIAGSGGTITVLTSVLLSSLTCAPSTIGPNATSACTVTLTSAAPAGGASVALSSNNAALTVPASVTVAAAATTASFSAASHSLDQ